MKRILTALIVTSALFATSTAQAASYQDRAMATGAIIGATSGAVIGSAHHQPVEGAIFGAVLGTVAGAVIASQAQPVHVVHRPHHSHYRRPIAYQHSHRAHYRTHQSRYNGYERSHRHGHHDRN